MMRDPFQREILKDPGGNTNTVEYRLAKLEKKVKWIGRSLTTLCIAVVINAFGDIMAFLSLPFTK